MSVIVIFLDLTFGQSYIYGKAFYKNGTYLINIQYGSREVMLPYDVLGFIDSKEAIIEFYRNDGSKVTLKHNIKVSKKDMIEIYDDWLTDELAKDLPVEMHIMF
jgi:hypothetical protein